MRSLYQRKCLSCLKPYQTYEEEKVYCTDQCKVRHVIQSVKKKRKRQPASGEKACTHCNAIFSPHARTQVYCSAICSMAVARKKRNGLKVVFCQECDSGFYPITGSVKFCSESCLRASNKKKEEHRTIERRKQSIGKESRSRRISYEALNRMEEKKRLESL